ncbi:MAG TPA: hypothetical protein VFF36_08870, partial [Planctomycetota bacterium]|nr:hypothetical protein [Planctomycetota bacterium]
MAALLDLDGDVQIEMEQLADELGALAGRQRRDSDRAGPGVGGQLFEALGFQGPPGERVVASAGHEQDGHLVVEGGADQRQAVFA